MTGPPSPKRQRTEEPKPTEVDEKIQKVLESVGKVEEELEKENEKQAQEILAIETKYNKAKRPTYVKRSKLFEEIPSFWKQVLLNHPLVAHCIDENDEKILEHLKALDVTFVDDNGGFKIELTFNENPFFTSTSLWKQVKFSDEGEVDVTAEEIAWKTSDEAKEVSESSSFFEWFSATEGDQDIAEIIKDDLWKNPVQFYLNDEEDEDEEEEEGEEGDDDEEEEEAEGEGEDEE